MARVCNEIPSMNGLVLEKSDGDNSDDLNVTSSLSKSIPISQTENAMTGQCGTSKIFNNIDPKILTRKYIVIDPRESTSHNLEALEDGMELPKLELYDSLEQDACIRGLENLGDDLCEYTLNPSETIQTPIGASVSLSFIWNFLKGFCREICSTIFFLVLVALYLLIQIKRKY